MQTGESSAGDNHRSTLRFDVGTYIANAIGVPEKN